MKYEKLYSPDISSTSNYERKMSQLALAVGGFAIGTAEFVSMGLLPEMARATSVQDAVAGQYIAAYAIGVVIGAPVLAVATAKMSRKKLLIGLMLCYAFANILSAFSFNYNSLLITRFISGLPHGIFFGVATVAVAAMVPVVDRPKAIGNVMLGLTVATVVGAPAATLVGQIFSWSVAFILVGLVSILCVVMVMRYMPATTLIARSSALEELDALKQKQVWLMLAVVSVGAGGLFAVFSYIKPILTHEAHFSVEYVPFIMPLLGCGMVIGNIVGPKIAVKIGIMRTIFYTMLVSTIIYILFYFLCQEKISAAIGCFLVGLSFSSIPSIQTRIMDVASNAQTLAGALIQSAFNIANAIGARAGGAVLMLGFSYADTGLLGAALTFIGFLIFCFSWYLDHRDTLQAAEAEASNEAESSGSKGEA